MNNKTELTDHHAVDGSVPTIRSALRDASSVDRGAGLARVDAQHLLLHVMGRSGGDRAWLVAQDDLALSAEQALAWRSALARRVSGEPVAYIVGSKAFYGLDLKVDSRVLDPRADTETLVDWALELIAPLSKAVLVDLGTGSGAIALALAAQRPAAQVHGVDADSCALQVARANGDRLGLSVHWHQGNWWAAIEALQPPLRADVAVGNPPYIAQSDPHLLALRHEPLHALVSAEAGLADLRQIARAAGGHLRPGGWLLLEHGFEQGVAVRELFVENGFARVETRRDLGGQERITGGQFPGAR